MENSKRFANEIANEIISRTSFDLEEISLLIQVRLKQHVVEIMTEYSSKEENEYLKLLTQQKGLHPRSTRYIELGYDLAIARKRLASVNRALNNIKKESRYEFLRDYVLNTFGENALDEINEKLTTKWR